MIRNEKGEEVVLPATATRLCIGRKVGEGFKISVSGQECFVFVTGFNEGRVDLRLVSGREVRFERLKGRLPQA